jgi:polynucleotide 5'-hydroxyl-kinase GRC3/NOL9
MEVDALYVFHGIRNLLLIVFRGEDPIISTFTPSLDQNVFFDHTLSSVYLVLSPSETLSFVGTVSLTVVQGTISLFGSLLHTSTRRHRVYAPKNHPVARIEAIEAPKEIENRMSLPMFLASSVNQSQTVIMVQDLNSGIQGLAKICGIQQSDFETLNELKFDFKLREFHPVS